VLQQPDNVPALRVAAATADAVGEHDRADGYRRLAAALAGSPPPRLAGESGRYQLDRGRIAAVFGEVAVQQLALDALGDRSDQ
jgi:hypothetical protein